MREERCKKTPHLSHIANKRGKQNSKVAIKSQETRDATLVVGDTAIENSLLHFFAGDTTNPNFECDISLEEFQGSSWAHLELHSQAHHAKSV